MRPGDEVVARLTRKGENYYVESHPLIIQPVTKPYNEYPIIVNPTQAPRHSPVVTITATEGGTYEVYTATGTLVHCDTFKQGDTPVTLPAINGIYFIRTHLGNKADTHKVLIY